MSDTPQDGVERDEVVELVALLDEVESRFCDLGHQQTMSVGPVLSDVKALRESVVSRGKGYGILSQSESVMDLRADAHDLNVSVSQDTGVSRGDSR